MTELIKGGAYYVPKKEYIDKELFISDDIDKEDIIKTFKELNQIINGEKQ